MGEAECRFVTCDLTEEYVRINADYSTVRVLAMTIGSSPTG